MMGGVFSERTTARSPDTISVMLEYREGYRSAITGKGNRLVGTAETGEARDRNHTANLFDCIRSRKHPTPPVEIGYKSAIAVLMSNIAYRENATSPSKRP
jgi:hypothetical protein